MSSTGIDKTSIILYLGLQTPCLFLLILREKIRFESLGMSNLSGIEIFNLQTRISGLR